jgi:SAM-dependent methyltransferase
MRMFGRPQGLAGRLGGRILARANRPFAEEVVAFLDVEPSDMILEIGFGPGVAIELLARKPAAGRVAGIDVSTEMVEQARARNAAAIGAGALDLRYGTVEHLPFEDAAFDLALAINSMQVWPDRDAGLREIRRVLRPGGRSRSRSRRARGSRAPGWRRCWGAAGFEDARVAELRGGFCIVAFEPR